ncbi:MAG: SDR family oxidoreductase [Flavobacteriales bacterium]|nr:SDR family oxidoreductase [Flavobacteriales bacterium]
MESKERRDEWVIVTGASRGIGREVVLDLVRSYPVSVLAVARDRAALEDLQQAIGPDTEGLRILAADLGTDAGVHEVIAVGRELPIRALVNNAGAFDRRTIGDWSRHGLEKLFHVNAFAPLLLAQGLRDRFLAAPMGHVLNIGSMGGFQGSAKFAGLLGYSSSKAALAGISECLAEELAPYGVACNCLALGAVDTEMLRAAFPDFTGGTSAEAMGAYIARFAMEGQQQYNGKVLPVSRSVP